MSDLISREDAIEALKRAEALTKAFGYHNVIDTIRELPSAQPERKKGEWVKFDDGDCHCSECQFVLEDWTQGIFYNFCPNCGADMKGEKNERTD